MLLDSRDMGCLEPLLRTSIPIAVSYNCLIVVQRAEVVAGMIAAKLTGTKWKAPEWLPEHYLMTWGH